MNLVDRLDEIIELNKRKTRELCKVQLITTERIGFRDYVLPFEKSLYIKMKHKEEISKKYNDKIDELYIQINKNLKNNDKLINPFASQKGDNKK